MESVSDVKVVLIRMQTLSPEGAPFMAVFSGETKTRCDFLVRLELLAVALEL